MERIVPLVRISLLSTPDSRGSRKGKKEKKLKIKIITTIVLLVKTSNSFVTQDLTCKEDSITNFFHDF